MPWFWGRSAKADDEEEEEYESGSSDYEDYTDSDEDDEGEGGNEEGEDDQGAAASDQAVDDAAAVATGAAMNGDGQDEQDGKQQEADRHVGPEEGRGGRGDHSSSSHADGDSSAAPSSQEGEEDEMIAKGVIPLDVGHGLDGGGNRGRADSAITLEDDDMVIAQGAHGDDESSSGRSGSSGSADEDSNGEGDEVDSSAERSKDEEEEAATSTAEKHSLMVLAAEHDRVDILQAILKSNSNSGNEGDMASSPSASAEIDEGAESDVAANPLLSEGIPPLHIAVSYGSLNATNCLLRMGADPSLRPDVAAILQENPDLDIPNIKRFDDVTAWELAFGDANYEQQQQQPRSWGLFGGGSSSNMDVDMSEHSRTSTTSSNSNRPRRRRKVIRPVDMAPSKREGIRHAFTAEALRSIGSDEVLRLKQLLDSGMPATIDIGGKNLYDWSVEMDALQCEELLRPGEASRHQDDEGDTNDKSSTTTKVKTVVLERMQSKTGQETTLQLINRLDELESLSMALSVSLDSLAEEVSVCNGLLLMGGGASALASHVRSLKALKENKMQELERMGEAWENSEDELAYWVREGGDEAKRIADKMMMMAPPGALRRRSSLSATTTAEEEEAQHRQLKAQIAASEHKIVKLRASIADLSEACSRDLEEVEKRGLSGGINLVRGLREEIREIDFQLSEAKSGEAACRTKISLIQSRVHASRKNSNPANTAGATNSSTSDSNKATAETDNRQSLENGGGPGSSLLEEPVLVERQEAAQSSNGASSERRSVSFATSSSGSDDEDVDTGSSDNNGMLPSERIASGQSTAIALRNGGDDGQGFFPSSLWSILLRIIGFRSGAGQQRQASAARPPPPPPPPRRSGSHNAQAPVMLV